MSYDQANAKRKIRVIGIATRGHKPIAGSDTTN